MSDTSKLTTVINVSGESTIYRSAERCEVSLRISHTSTDQSDCLKRVTSLTNELSTHLKTLSPKDEQGQATTDAPVTWFEMSSLNSTSWIPSPPRDPYGQKSEQETKKEEPKRQYRTSTNFKVKFRDFKKMSEVLGDLGKREDAHIDSLSWRLTDKTRESFQTQARQGAYSDALRKAQDYAQMVSTGKGELTCTQVSDGHSGRVMRSMYAAGSHGGMRRRGGGGVDEEEEGEEVINFQPNEVGISANVNCTFELRV